jgi:hypothetical protein
MKIGTNGGWRTAAGANDDEGGADHLGEKRERKRREKEEEADDSLSIGLVAPNGLA